MTLVGTTYAVTGASRGIGRALTLGLARQGANIVLSARNQTALDDVAEEGRQMGVDIEVVAGDVAEPRVTKAIVAAAVNLGNFSGYIHNAAVMHPGPFIHELDASLFEQVIRTGLTAGCELARAAYPHLSGAKGIAVYIGSGSADVNTPGLGAYGIAKLAEEHLARQLATEVPAVTCFVYRPGTVDTDMQGDARQASGSAGEMLHRVFSQIQASGRLQSPEDAVTPLVALLDGDPRPYHGRTVTAAELRSRATGSAQAEAR